MLSGNLNENDHMENLVMGGRRILVLNKWVGVGGIISIQNRDQWRIIVIVALDHRLLQRARNFLYSYVTAGLSRTSCRAS